MPDLKIAEVTAFPAPIADAVRQAAKSFFGSICGMDPIPVVHGQDGPGSAGVVGVISFAGTLTWSFALMFPETTATAMAQKFAGFEIPFDSRDMGDVIGELANVIAGDISARLDAKGIAAQLSLPTVTRGYDVDLFVPLGLPTLHLGYASPQGPFWFRLVTAKADVSLGRRSGS
jgi:chemotaxis protein CheX